MDRAQTTDKPFGGKEATIFVIDCRTSMFDASGVQSPFKLAVKCVRNEIANIAVSGSSDEIAVILIGTQKMQNSHSFQNIFILQLLKQASAELVLSLDDLSREDKSTFTYGLDEDYSLGELFWLCDDVFRKDKKKYYGKSVKLFTNEDDPYKDAKYKSKRQHSVFKASDLKSNNVEIIVIDMAPDFDFVKYYNEIVTIPQLNRVRECTKLESLMERVRMKSHKQRVFATVPFDLGCDCKLSVSVFVLVRETKKPFSIKLDRRTNALLASETRLVGSDDKVVEKSEVVKHVEYGGETIYFDDEDQRQLKNNDPHLTLLGFKPVDYLQEYYHKTPAYFIIPNESVVKGSNCLFNALLQQCSKRRVVAICKGVFRRTSGISLIGLIPQIESVKVPGGFHAVILPFAEDIRELNLQAASPVNVEPELIDAAKDIIKSLKLDYAPDMIKNPALQKFYANIEALALCLDAAEETKDDLKPNLDLIEKVLNENRHKFDVIFESEKYSLSDNAKNDVIDDLREAAKCNKLGKLTVKQLTEFCKSKDIECGRTKAVIIDAINKYYECN